MQRYVLDLFSGIGGFSLGLDRVLLDLENEGYTARPVIIPACAVNAPHRRDRVWILATNPEHHRSAKQEREHEGAEIVNGSSTNRLATGSTLANADSDRQQERGAPCLPGRGRWGYPRLLVES